MSVHSRPGNASRVTTPAGAHIPFAHLQVATSASLQYGTAHPDAVMEHAAELNQKIIAITDRDGVYGAVQAAQAAHRAGIAVILGADLAVESTVESVSKEGARRTPARGGAWIDESQPRVTFLAVGRQGWSSLVRLISAAHHDRGNPVVPWSALQEHHQNLVALVGVNSEAGWWWVRDRPWRVDSVMRPWRAIFGKWLGVVVASHRRPLHHRYSTDVAARMVRWARSNEVPVVLSNAVRYLTPESAPTADVLDASRLLVPLGSPRLEPANGEAFLKTAEQMREVAEEIARAAGDSAEKILRDTWKLAEFCAGDARETLGIGDVFVPELDVLVGRAVTDPVREANTLLWSRCEKAIPTRYASGRARKEARERLEQEMHTITTLGFSGYFLTVADVVDMITERGVRVAARGSGAGSLVTHLLGISGVDPMEHGLLMERFLSPLRRTLPDIDIDVESARRLEIYEWIFERFGHERVATVAMRETYRVRHAIRDVGAALRMPQADIDAFAHAFPHIRARQIRSAFEDLPELRNSPLGKQAARGELDRFMSLVESLDGLPRHMAMHPCGVILSDLSLRDRTPVEPTSAGFAMSQFDKDDVEQLGLLKLDVLGVRMQSAIAHALDQIEVTTGQRVELDTTLADPETFALIQSTRTLGCFQIESPGQRELIGKFAPEYFSDLIIDISLFRPGPVKSDMITPFLRARQGWSAPVYPHPDLQSILESTYGVVVFHEQVMQIMSCMTGCSLAQADDYRRAMGTAQGQDDVRTWFYPAARARGYTLPVIEQVWDILHAFASFGFCKAHAAAFALPTYQSAWLKTHYPAAFFSGLLTHDPGMYPQRLIIDDARHCGVSILGLDVNASSDVYHVEKDASGNWGIRVPFTQVSGIHEEEVQALMEAAPFLDLEDLLIRTGVSRPTAENLVLAGACDALYGFGEGAHRRGNRTRRDLLLQIADHRGVADRARSHGVRTKAGGGAQLVLPMAHASGEPSGLPELSPAERVQAELEILGMDVSHHVMDFYAPLCAALPIVRAEDLLTCRSEAEILVAGVKVATSTPPIRTGKRVVFITLDDSTGPLDATFFDDVQGAYAHTLFGSWILLVRGVVRRTGPRGVSLRATGCWELGEIHRLWRESGAMGVRQFLGSQPGSDPESVRGAMLIHASGFRQSPYADVRPASIPRSARGHMSPGTSGPLA